ncbi:SIS domain-containing protein [Hypoxylon sp. FL1284]|nr:SIS domain-containing protein [Hypoxylon sp. FL1284]
MVEHHPVHNSEVYLLGLTPRLEVPPPSPPSPLTARESESSSAIEELDLDNTGDDFKEELETDLLAKQRLSGAVHVLNTEATALRDLTQLYRTDAAAAQGFNEAVGAITRHNGKRGKLVIIGVGKSGHIGKKLVASFNSLGVHATFLHPTEALHGDLGKIGSQDTVLFITFSGRTPELLQLLPHIDAALPVVVLTSHARPDACELARRRPGAVLLPAPVHEPEAVSFGVSAPTTSTTVALALGDALALVAAREMHPAVVPAVFARNHPGGAIGQAFQSRPRSIQDLAVSLRNIPVWDPATSSRQQQATGSDVLMLGYGSPSGWVRVGDAVASPARIRRLNTAAHATTPAPAILGLLVERAEWIGVRADTALPRAAEWLAGLLASANCGEDAILAVTDENLEVVGVLEAGQLLDHRE